MEETWGNFWKMEDLGIEQEEDYVELFLIKSKYPAGMKYRSRMLKDTHRFFREEFCETGAARLRACVKRIRAPKGFLYDLISLLSPVLIRSFPCASTPRFAWLLATAGFLRSDAHITKLFYDCTARYRDVCICSSRESLINEKRD